MPDHTSTPAADFRRTTTPDPLAPTGRRHRVVIVGGGFGGVAAARTLCDADVDITLIDQRNHHLFQPLLYQVATGALSPGNIAAPLRFIFRKHANVEVVLGKVIGFHAESRTVYLEDGGEFDYDSLIVATGSTFHYFGNDWSTLAPGLKSVEDATDIRQRILFAFEQAERSNDPTEIAKWMTFVIVGGGPTGLEMAGTLAEVARHTLKHEFRRIDTTEARVLLVEGADRLLPPMHPELSAEAERLVRELGVQVRKNTFVTHIDPDGVTLSSKEHEERLETKTVVWAAGVKGSPLGDALAEATGVELAKGGRVKVAPDCSVPNHPNIFVIGDLAYVEDDDGAPLPGVAPVALQQGKFVGRVIAERVAHGEPPRKFSYTDRGIMATIGRAAAVADIRGRRFSGVTAWLLWLFVHLFFLIGFQNRMLVLMQWAWSYLTWNRSARLITERRAPY